MPAHLGEEPQGWLDVGLTDTLKSSIGKLLCSRSLGQTKASKGGVNLYVKPLGLKQGDSPSF